MGLRRDCKTGRGAAQRPSAGALSGGGSTEIFVGESGYIASSLLKNTLGPLSLWERAGVRVKEINPLFNPLTRALSP